MNKRADDGQFNRIVYARRKHAWGPATPSVCDGVVTLASYCKRCSTSMHVRLAGAQPFATFLSGESFAWESHGTHEPECDEVKAGDEARGWSREEAAE